MCSSWGYDQTNIDFYQVVRTSRACVWVRPIARQSSGLGGMTGECVPLPGKFTGPEFRALVDPLRKNIKVGCRQYASLLSPKIVAGVKIYAPQTWTAYA